MTLSTDDARNRFQKITARFAEAPAGLALKGAMNVRQSGREFEILANGNREEILAELRARQPEELRCDSLTLEEIFVAAGTVAKGKA